MVPDRRAGRRSAESDQDPHRRRATGWRVRGRRSRRAGGALGAGGGVGAAGGVGAGGGGVGDGGGGDRRRRTSWRPGRDRRRRGGAVGLWERPGWRGRRTGVRRDARLPVGRRPARSARSASPGRGPIGLLDPAAAHQGDDEDHQGDEEPERTDRDAAEEQTEEPCDRDLADPHVGAGGPDDRDRVGVRARRRRCSRSTRTASRRCCRSSRCHPGAGPAPRRSPRSARARRGARSACRRPRTRTGHRCRA